MFDIGFMELALIGVVALVVIGPERLPGVARNVGKWIGSARRFVSSVQADINLEVNKAETLKRLLEEQTDIKAMHEILEQTPADLVSRKPVPFGRASSSTMAAIWTRWTWSCPTWSSGMRHTRCTLDATVRSPTSPASSVRS